MPKGVRAAVGTRWAGRGTGRPFALLSSGRVMSRDRRGGVSQPTRTRTRARTKGALARAYQHERL